MCRMMARPLYIGATCRNASTFSCKVLTMCLILTKTENGWQFLIKFSSTKFHKNLFSCFWVQMNRTILTHTFQRWKPPKNGTTCFSGRVLLHGITVWQQAGNLQNLKAVTRCFINHYTEENFVFLAGIYLSYWATALKYTLKQGVRSDSTKLRTGWHFLVMY